ncbi:MAG: hypothetical protein ACOC53_01475 [Candidatus Saliniplasma sp.]
MEAVEVVVDTVDVAEIVEVAVVHTVAVVVVGIAVEFVMMCFSHNKDMLNILYLFAAHMINMF